MMKIKLIRLLLIILFMPISSSAFAVDHIITVAKKGGDFNSIKKALASIYDNSETNRYLISIGPGVFSVTEQINMKSYVSIKGSGVGVTKLISRIKDLGSNRAMFYGDVARETSITDLSVDMYVNHTYLSDRILVCGFREFVCPALKDVDLLLRSKLPTVSLLGIDLDSSLADFRNIKLRVSGRSHSVGIAMWEGRLNLEKSEVIANTALALTEAQLTLRNAILRSAGPGGAAILTTFSDLSLLGEIFIINSHLRASGSADPIGIDPMSVYPINISHSILETESENAWDSAPNLTCTFTGDGHGGIYDENCLLIP